jgi:hypothetical protein
MLLRRIGRGRATRAFPLGVDPVRLQRVVNAMSRFGLLPQGTTFNVNSMIIGG